MLKTKNKLLVVFLSSVFLIWGGSSQPSVIASGVTCDSVEYSCWGKNVPIPTIACDEVYEQEVIECNDSSGNGPCGCDCIPNDPNDQGAGCTIPDICPGECCTVTNYSCSFCAAGRIFPYPERPEGKHGDADKCPTDDDLGQFSGTGLTGDASALIYDYDLAKIINVPPIQFNQAPAVPTATPTPLYGITATVTPNLTLVPSSVATPTPTLMPPTPTPTGPIPSGGWPTHTPTPTATATPIQITPPFTPTPLPGIDPDAPCGWPVDSRRVTQKCGTGGVPEDSTINPVNYSHSYEAIDVGGNPAGTSSEVRSTMDGYAYRCVNTLGIGGSYGAYVVVTESAGDMSGWSTLYAHFVPQSGDVEPGDANCDVATTSDVCMQGDCIISEGSVSEGDVIGNTGWTGPIDGLHVHYEVWQGSKLGRICPANLMDETANVCGGDQPLVFRWLNSGLATIWDAFQSLLQAINPFSSHMELARR